MYVCMYVTRCQFGDTLAVNDHGLVIPLPVSFNNRPNRRDQYYFRIHVFTPD